MKKSLVAMAVAGALVAPAAMADEVKIYGKVDIGIGNLDNGTTSTVQVASQVTRLGFSGSETLDRGMSVVWQIEQQIDIDGTTTSGVSTAAGAGGTGGGGNHFTFASRNSFLGLKHDVAGTVLFGIHDTPYKMATADMDVFRDQMPDNRALMGGSLPVTPTTTTSVSGYQDMRATDVLAYISPRIGNMATILAAYIAGAEVPTAAPNNIKGSGYSLAGLFDIGPVHASAAYQAITYGSTTTGTLAAPPAPAGAIAANDTFKAMKVGASYTIISPLTVNAVVERLSSSGAGTSARNNGLGRTDIYVSAVYRFTDSDDVKLAITKAGKLGVTTANSGGGAKQMSVGYDHALSRNTGVYAQYTRISNDANANYGISNAGTTLQNGVVLNGKTVSGLMLGINHSF